MAALLLRLLLILTLVANAVGAPSAMAGMRHAQPGAQERHDHGHAHGQAAVPPGPAIAHADHAGMHHGHDAATAPLSAQTDSSAPASCCEDGQCACGCMLPPMLARTTPAVCPLPWSASPTSATPRWPLLARTSPPFRPPAG